MPSNSIDYDMFHKTISNKTYRLDEVKHRLEKVAFDVVRFKDGDPDDLWQIQNADDGSYIVAKYTDDTVKEAKASAKEWDVITSQAGYVHFYYNGEPLGKLSADTLGIPAADLPSVKRWLPAKLAADQNFVKALRDELVKSGQIDE